MRIKRGNNANKSSISLGTGLAMCEAVARCSYLEHKAKRRRNVCHRTLHTLPNMVTHIRWTPIKSGAVETFVGAVTVTPVLQATVSYLRPSLVQLREDCILFPYG